MGRSNFKVDTMSIPVTNPNDQVGVLKPGPILIILVKVYSKIFFEIVEKKFFFDEPTKRDLFYYLGDIFCFRLGRKIFAENHIYTRYLRVRGIPADFRVSLQK